MAEVTVVPYGERGLGYKFSYDPGMVSLIKRIPATQWDKGAKVWWSEGPESILDARRLGLNMNVSIEAYDRIQKLDAQIEAILTLRAQGERSAGEQYAFQKIGTKILLAQERGILADDMGLGKTKQTLDATWELWQDGRARSIIVLCMKSQVYNWPKEMMRWGYEMPHYIIPDDKKRRKEFWDNWSREGVIIGNYEKLTVDDFPSDLQPDILICDEVTYVKGYRSLRHRETKRLAAKAGYVWFLTGTPIEVRMEELYTVMAALRPTVLGGFNRFRDEHLIVGWDGQVRGAKNEEVLHERVSPWILRRTKQDVGVQLPEVVRSSVWAEMSRKQWADHERLKNDFDDWLRERGEEVGEEVSEALQMTQVLRFQQFTSSPDLLDFGYRGAKFEQLEELLAGWEGQALIVTRFRQMALRLHEWLGLPARAIIHGDTPAQDRIEIIDEFREEGWPALIGTDAIAYGLNIQHANLLVHYDLLWNPMKMEQREGRISRIGSSHETVNAVQLLVPGTIDEGMDRVVRMRANMIEAFMEGSEESITRKVNIRRIINGEEG